MKKYGWLIAVTAALSLAITAAGAMIRAGQTTVRVTAAHRQYVEQTVTCTGAVEPAGGEIRSVAATKKDAVQIRVAVPERRLKQVAVGQRVSVSGAAFGAEQYTGTVASLGNTAYLSPTGGAMVDAVIDLDAPDDTLKCGLTAKAAISVDGAEGVLIPYNAIREDETGKEYVYIYEKQHAHRRYITGTELTDGVLVKSGIQDGEWLIDDPDNVKKDGARVQAEVSR